MQTSIGLVLAFVSAMTVNWAYSREHDAAAAMPPFSLRRPFAFVEALLAERAWLAGFGAECGGWLVYVAALRLAPISLVQAVGASGIAVLAVASAHGHPGRLPQLHRVAVLVATAGLALLALSLVGNHQADRAPSAAGVAIWLGSLAGGASILVGTRVHMARGPALGLAAGLLFAGGDMSAKLVVYGGAWFAAIGSLIVFYASGTAVLQTAFQRTSALTAAGLATLASNAVPIAAGFVLFGEELPLGAKGALQIAAFASLVAGAMLLGHAAAERGSSATEPQT